MMLHIQQLIFAMFVLFGMAEASKAACRHLSLQALKQKLLAVGGTLNPQLVAINAKGARRFKPHIRVNSMNRIITRGSRDADDNDDDDDDEDIYDEDIEDLYNVDDHKDDDERRHPRKRRSTSLGACHSPGTPMNNRYPLCHSCVSTTVLSTEYFPRYINEVICKPGVPATCFQGQGECSENAMPTIFLKKTGQCILDNSGNLVDGWEAVTKYVRTCCECKLYPGSFLIPLTL